VLLPMALASCGVWVEEGGAKSERDDDDGTDGKEMVEGGGAQSRDIFFVSSTIVSPEKF
jgi:hypothetical protein